MEFLELMNGSDVLIVSFSSCASKLEKFEFYKFLIVNFNENNDCCFYQDMKKKWYHKGIKNISKNIQETKTYLNNIIKKYKKVIFIGISSGGYAAILFGSLYKIDYVIALIPQVFLKNPIDKKYKNLKNYINFSTKYILFGNPGIVDIDNLHSIKQCHILKCFKNVHIIEIKNLNIKNLVSSKKFYKLINNLI